MGPDDKISSSVLEEARLLLADFTRCPSCAATLPGDRCPACGIDLSGVDGRRVGELSVRAGQLLSERAVVVKRMQDLVSPAPTSTSTSTSAPAPAAAPVPVAPVAASDWSAPTEPASSPSVSVRPAPSAVAGPKTSPPPPAPPVSSVPAGPRVSTMDEKPGSGLGVHGLLVGLGALLLSVAAIGFLVFSWQVLSLPGRAAVIATATFGVLATASWLQRRLPETAEAVGALGVVLVLADCWAIRRTGLFGADQPQGLSYAAAAAAISALLLGGWALLSRVRAGSWAAVVLAPSAVLLLTARLDGELGEVPTMAAGFLLAAALTLGRELLPVLWQAERWLLRAVALLTVLGAVLPAVLAQPGPARAALLLALSSLVTVAQSGLDRSSALTADRSLQLRRGWSLAGGLLAGTAALQAAVAVSERLDLDGVSVLLPLTGLPALVLLGAAQLPRTPWTSVKPRAAIRRTAFGAGTAVVTAVVGLPLLALAGWLPIRAALVGAQAWSTGPGHRFGDLDPNAGATTQTWLTALLALAVVGGCCLLAVRLSGWPTWLRRPVRVVAAVCAGLVVLVLPLVPDFAVVSVVIALAVLSLLLAVALVNPRSGVGSRSWTWIWAGWAAGGLTGTLSVLLAWSTRELSVPLTVIGLVGLLLARRRLPRPVTGVAALASASLAGLAAVALSFAVAAGAGLAGASDGQRLVWAGLVGGLSAAALFGLPALSTLPALSGLLARPGRTAAGRAGWTGVDRLAAAAPGLVTLVIGLLATLPDSDFPSTSAAWPRPVLLAVALLIALVGTVAVRPAVAQALPLLPPASALAVTPLLGALAAAIRAALPYEPTWPALSLLWAIAAAVGAFAVAVVVLSGRTRTRTQIDPARRLTAELGVAATALIGLVLVNGLDRLWPVLLVLGTAATAIAATPDRHRVGWLAGLLLTGSTWSRLADGNVTLVEAYSLPPALALLGLALFRFRQDRSTDPLKALLPVASVGLAPSVLAAAGGSPVRPVVLLVLAAVLVLFGQWGHRRAGLYGPSVVLAAIGVVGAAATAGLRAAVTVSDLPSSTVVALTQVEVWTIPAAMIVLTAGLSLKLIQPIKETDHYLKWAAAPPVLAALLLAGVPTLLAALRPTSAADTAGAVDLVDGWSVVRVAVVLGVSILAALAGIRRHHRSNVFLNDDPATGSSPENTRELGLVPGAIALAVLAAVGGGLTLAAGPLEAWSLPLAALLLVQAWSRFDRFAAAQPSSELRPSWPVHGPAVAVLLLPSLVLGWPGTDTVVLRPIVLIALATATLVIGARYRLQAPVLLGAAVLIVQAVILLLPWIALLGAVPLWGWLAAVGLGLVLLGARYEARIKQLKAVRLRLAALR